MNNNHFHWSPGSAFNKLTSDITFNISTPTPIISVSKSFNITPPLDVKKDAYRNCAKCGKHYNFHKNGQCC